MSIYIPERAREAQLIEQLESLAQKRRRSLSFLVLEAIARYLEVEQASESEQDQDGAQA